MTAYDPAQWATLAATVVGAAAALTGLIFVSISLNLAEILVQPGLPERALETLIILVGIMVASALVLFPGADSTNLGWALLVLGAGLGLWVAIIHVGARSRIVAEYRGYYRRALVSNEATPVLLVVAGLATLSQTFGGLLWLGVADLFGIAVAVINAWVLLVEIKR